jgi:hypothetical protein
MLFLTINIKKIYFIIYYENKLIYIKFSIIVYLRFYTHIKKLFLFYKNFIFIDFLIFLNIYLKLSIVNNLLTICAIIY